VEPGRRTPTVERLNTRAAADQLVYRDVCVILVAAYRTFRNVQ
jgi:hypothetical protein